MVACIQIFYLIDKVMIMDLYEIGSHLKVARLGYTHHGIYIGDNKVIHYAGFCETFKSGPIEIADLTKFQGKAKKIKVVNYHGNEKFSPAEIVERAFSKLGENNYDLFRNNCEHFAHWCVTGIFHSKQVSNAVKAVCAIGAAVLPAVFSHIKRK